MKKAELLAALGSAKKDEEWVATACGATSVALKGRDRRAFAVLLQMEKECLGHALELGALIESLTGSDQYDF